MIITRHSYRMLAGISLALTVLVSTGEAAAASQEPATCEMARVAVRRPVSFQSNGKTINGLVYAPTGAPNGAGIVMLHGARGLGGELETYDAIALDLASRGYQVILPAYYDATSGSPVRSGRNERAWRAVARDAAEVLTSGSGAAAGKIGVWGFSLGGFMAVTVATDGAMPFPVGVGVAAGTDVDRPERVSRTASILLIHADRDPVISAGSTQALAQHLRRAGVPVEVQPLRSSQHFFEPPIWCDVARRSRAFFDAHLL